MAKEVTVVEKTEEFSPLDVLLLVLSNASTKEQGMTFADMHKRLRVIDVVTEAKDEGRNSFVLEDADYNKLKDVMDGFQGFSGGSPAALRHLTKLHECINNAKKPVKEKDDTE